MEQLSETVCGSVQINHTEGKENPHGASVRHNSSQLTFALNLLQTRPARVQLRVVKHADAFPLRERELDGELQDRRHGTELRDTCQS